MSPRPCNDRPTRDLGRTLNAMGLGLRLGRVSSDRNLRGRCLVGMRPSVGHVISGAGFYGIGEWRNVSLNRIGDLV